MIVVTDLRSGTIFEENGNLLQVLSYEHIKMGRGSANIKVKVKNVRTGATVDKSFINGAKVNNVQVLKKDLQYLYKDGDGAYFMNPSTFEQVSIPLKIVGSDAYYLKEGESYNISFLGEEALSLNLPPKMVFEVSETAPGVKGNSATNVFKDAILENGLTVKVPLFIKIGDKVRIDTRTAVYTEKAAS
ncbi:MAG: elongation factor P [Candidatus Levybacteria bacterium RBG_13_35_9]|nr:MAG: elongation factor P [Candidatus Levybacteria bacterium RBG_13_35_9]